MASTEAHGHGHLKLEYQPSLPLNNGKLFLWLFLSTEIMFFAGLIGTDVKAAMQGVNASAYVRVPFDLGTVDGLSSAVLRMKYDAGFVAYLNGTEVARRNAPGGTPAYDAAATAERSNVAALAYEDIDVSAFAHLLTAGAPNVLAVHALNSSAGDDDLLVMPELRLTYSAPGSLQFMSTTTPGAANVPGSALMMLESPRKGALWVTLANLDENSPKLRCWARSRTRPKAAMSQNAVEPPLPRTTS